MTSLGAAGTLMASAVSGVVTDDDDVPWSFVGYLYASSRRTDEEEVPEYITTSEPATMAPATAAQTTRKNVGVNLFFVVVVVVVVIDLVVVLVGESLFFTVPTSPPPRARRKRGHRARG